MFDDDKSAKCCQQSLSKRVPDPRSVPQTFVVKKISARGTPDAAIPAPTFRETRHAMPTGDLHGGEVRGKWATLRRSVLGSIEAKILQENMHFKGIRRDLHNALLHHEPHAAFRRPPRRLRPGEVLGAADGTTLHSSAILNLPRTARTARTKLAKKC